MNERRTFLDRFLAAVPIAAAALALLALLFWEASTRKTPTIFSDEIEWTQLSRAIAATGRAARRGDPTSFKSLYAYLIAPAWWVHSTATAYAVAKYIGMTAMALAAIPTYLIARLLVSPRVAVVAALASICTSAMFYGGYLLPETLAYPTFVLVAWLCIRSLAGGGRRWTIAAIVGCLVATQVRDELVVVLGAYVVAALVLWLCGPTSARLRRGWRVWDYVGASVLGVGLLVLANQLASSLSPEYAVVTQTEQHHMWSLLFQACAALALGLGILPAIAGLAALGLWDRRGDPAWRAFAAFTGAALVTVGAYTGVKAAFLSGVFATRVEERNMIYLAPLLIVGAATYLTSRRIWLPGALAAWAFVTWLVTAYGYQLEFPYFEAPGYGIAVMANRAWHWDQPTIRTWLYVACVVAGLVVLAARAHLPESARAVVVGVAVAATVAWMLAGEITSARGAAATSRQFAANLTKPFDWVDRASHGQGVTMLSDNNADPTGVWLFEFWNRSIKHVWSLDATAPGPGPVLTPDVKTTDGRLSPDPGLDYVLTGGGVRVTGRPVAAEGGVALTRVAHPWHLRDVIFGRFGDGWIGSNARYSYLGPGRPRGHVVVTVSRSGFCNPQAPKAHVTVRVGRVRLTQQQKPTLGQQLGVRRFVLANCATQPVRFPVRPPFTVTVHVTPTVRPAEYGGSDQRELGAQVDWAFTPSR